MTKRSWDAAEPTPPSSESHAVDSATLLSFAMDLTPVVQDDTLSLAAHTSSIDAMKADVVRRLGE